MRHSISTQLLPASLITPELQRDIVPVRQSASTSVVRAAGYRAAFSFAQVSPISRSTGGSHIPMRPAS